MLPSGTSRENHLAARDAFWISSLSASQGEERTLSPLARGTPRFVRQGVCPAIPPPVEDSFCTFVVSPRFSEEPSMLLRNTTKNESPLGRSESRQALGWVVD